MDTIEAGGWFIPFPGGGSVMPDHDEDIARDAYLEMADDDTAGVCKECGERVRLKVYRGARPSMARFAEPDEDVLTCPTCGELDWDEVEKD